MANLEKGHLSTGHNEEKMVFDPRPVNIKALRTIAEKLVDQVIKTRREMNIDIEIPEISDRFSHVVNGKSILEAVEKEKEESLLDQTSAAMILSDRITIAKSFIILTSYIFPQPSVFEKFVEKEMEWD